MTGSETEFTGDAPSTLVVLTSFDHMLRHQRRYAAGAILILVISASVAGALAEFRAVLHEQFEPDPREDIEMGVRVTAAGLPAAIRGESGTLPLPDPSRPASRDEPTYAERQAAAPKTFAIDP
ncbi:MAG TPA: hypothetical protein VIV60_33155, partial [Polyangiaceae bacterium]